jgi:hypothetical protein
MTQQMEDVLWLTGSAIVVIGAGWIGWWVAGKVQDRLLRISVQRQIEEFEARRGR